MNSETLYLQLSSYPGLEMPYATEWQKAAKRAAPYALHLDADGSTQEPIWSHLLNAIQQSTHLHLHILLRPEDPATAGLRKTLEVLLKRSQKQPLVSVLVRGGHPQYSKMASLIRENT